MIFLCRTNQLSGIFLLNLLQFRAVASCSSSPSNLQKMSAAPKSCCPAGSESYLISSYVPTGKSTYDVLSSEWYTIGNYALFTYSINIYCHYSNNCNCHQLHYYYVTNALLTCSRHIHLGTFVKIADVCQLSLMIRWDHNSCRWRPSLRVQDIAHQRKGSHSASWYLWLEWRTVSVFIPSISSAPVIIIYY